MSLFNRLVRVTIGEPKKAGLSLSDFHISFEVVKTSTPSANTCTVKIWNLTEETRAKILKTDYYLVLEAGYEEDAGLIKTFVGNVTNVAHKLQPPNWITTVDAGDGIVALRESKVTLSCKAGHRVRDALVTVMNSFGLNCKKLPSGITDKKYTSGLSQGMLSREVMSKICDMAGLEWSVQSDLVQVLEKSGYTPDPVINLTPESGLLQPPDRITEQGQKSTGEKKDSPDNNFKLTSLLLPTVEPGRRICVKSRSASGHYRVGKVTHKGDNMTGDFQTELEVSSLEKVKK